MQGEIGKAFPQDPKEQLQDAIEAVFRSWNGDKARVYREHEGIADDLGTAVNVQSMVFGNKGDDSGTGVAFTRNPATGEQHSYGDFLANAQGEDVVAGIRATESLDAMADQRGKVNIRPSITFGCLCGRRGGLECHVNYHLWKNRVDPRRHAIFPQPREQTGRSHCRYWNQAQGHRDYSSS